MKTKLIKFKILVVIIGMILYSFIPREKNYCDGWEKGYVEGWCYKDQNCIKPITPICPIPDANFNTYDYGKKDGFIKGQKDRKK